MRPLFVQRVCNGGARARSRAAHCFPNRYLTFVGVNLVCVKCSAGTTSPGGSGDATRCTLCDFSLLPVSARFVVGGGCAWSCYAGFYGASCVPCSVYAIGDVALTSKQPAFSHWVDGADTCTWACNAGFALRNGTAGAAVCVPPAPPSAPHVVVLGDLSSPSTVRVSTALPPYPNTALVTAFHVFSSSVDGGPRDVVNKTVPAAAWDPIANNVSCLAVLAGSSSGDGGCVSFVFGGLHAGRVYSLRVETVVPGGVSGFSSASLGTIQMAPATVPSPPRAPTCTNAGGSHFAVSWLPAIDSGGFDVLTYTVCVAPTATGGPCFTLVRAPGNATAVQADGLLAATVYFVCVRAASIFGESSCPLIIPCTTSQLSAPSAPRGLACVAGSSVVTASWLASLDTGGGVVVYVVLLVVPGVHTTSATVPGNASALSAHFGGLMANTTYVVVASAGNGGDVASTIPLVCQTAAPTPPSIVSGFAVSSVGPSIVTLLIYEPADLGGAPLVSFLIRFVARNASVYRPFVSAVCMAGGATPVDCTVRNLAAGTQYDALVSATTAYDTGPESMPLVVSTSATAQPPGPVEAIDVVEIGATHVVVQWVGPSDDGGSPLLLYVVFFSVNSLVFTPLETVAVTTVASVSVVGLSPEEPVFVRIVATSAAGTSVAQQVSSRTSSMAVPMAPRRGHAAAVSPSSILTSWDSPRDAGGLPILNYSAEAACDGLPASVVTVSRGLSAVIDGLRGDTSYVISVRASNALGVGDVLVIGRASTMPARAPGPPAGVLAIATAPDSVFVLWTSTADDGGSPLVSVSLQLSDAITRALVVPDSLWYPPATTAAIYGVLGSQVCASLSTMNAAGRSNASLATACVTMPAACVPSAPGRVLATLIGVSWIPPSSSGGSPLLSYTVFASTDSSALGYAYAVAPDQLTFNLSMWQPTWYFRVTACTIVGCGALSNAAPWVVPARVPSAPSPPVVVSATSTTFTVALPAMTPASLCWQQLSWWTILVSPSVRASYEVTVPPDTSQFTVDDSATRSFGYTVSVAAVSAAGRGIFSSAVAASTLPASAPAPPASVVAGAGPNASVVVVEWSAPWSSGGLPVSNYVVNVTVDGVPWIRSVPSIGNPVPDMSAVFVYLVPPGAVTACVAAVNFIGASACRLTESAYDTRLPQLAAPIAVSFGGSLMGWGAISGAMAYRVCFSAAGEALHSCATKLAVVLADTTYVDVGMFNLPAGDYEVAVAVQKQPVGWSLWSPSLAISVVFAAPDPVTNLTMTSAPGQTQFALTWTAPVHFQGAISIVYHLSVVDQASGMLEFAANLSLTTCVVPVRYADSVYVASVRARTVGGVSPVVTLAVITAARSTPPDVETLAAAWVLSRAASLTWKYNASTGGQGTVFSVSVTGGGSTVDSTCSGLGTTLTPLLPGTLYSVRVLVTDSGGTSVGVVVEFSTLADNMALPRSSDLNVTVVAASQTSIRVTWAHAPNPWSVVSSVSVYVIDEGSGARVAMTRGETLPTFLVGGLAAAWRYRCSVAAVNRAGETRGRSMLLATPPFAAPGPPTFVGSVAMGSSSALLFVRLPTSDGGSPVSGVRAFVDGSVLGHCGVECVNATNGTAIFRVAHLLGSTVYVVAVVACNVAGCGAPAPAVQFMTSNPVSPGVSAAPRVTTRAASSMVVEWAPPDDNGGAPVVSYDVFVSADAVNFVLAVSEVAGVSNQVCVTFMLDRGV